MKATLKTLGLLTLLAMIMAILSPFAALTGCRVMHKQTSTQLHQVDSTSVVKSTSQAGTFHDSSTSLVKVDTGKTSTWWNYSKQTRIHTWWDTVLQNGQKTPLQHQETTIDEKGIIHSTEQKAATESQQMVQHSGDTSHQQQIQAVHVQSTSKLATTDKQVKSTTSLWIMGAIALGVLILVLWFDWPQVVSFLAGLLRRRKN